MTYRFERLADDVDKYADLIEHGIVNKEQAEGMFGLIHESLTRYREVAEFKPERVIDKNYREKVRLLPCIITGQPGPSDPHHVMTGGFGMKGSDLSVIPLSREIHRNVEDKGHAWLEKTFGVRVGDLVAKTMHLVLTGQELVLPNEV